MITPLVGLPTRTMTQSAFDAAVASLMTAWPTFITETNALAANLSNIAAGGSASIPYTFSTTTTDADPGNGVLRLSSATQNVATVIRADLLGSDGTTWTSLIDTFDDSTSTIKGFIMLQGLNNAANWIVFSVSSLASPSGYKNITVVPVASSAASPFANGDALLMKFTRNGDKGDTGATGANGAAGSNGAEILLQVIDASNSGSVDIETTFNSTYAAYIIRCTAITVQTDGVGIRGRMKINGSYDTGSNYNYQLAIPQSGNSTYAGASSEGAAQFQMIYDIGNATAKSGRMDVRLCNPDSTALYKGVIWDGYGIASGAPSLKRGLGCGYNSGTAALTGFRFYADSGNIVSGKFALYGIAKT